jgi:hypothetical protein
MVQILFLVQLHQPVEAQVPPPPPPHQVVQVEEEITPGHKLEHWEFLGKEMPEVMGMLVLRMEVAAEVAPPPPVLMQPAL